MHPTIIKKTLLAILSSSLFFQRTLRSFRAMACIYLRNKFKFWNVHGIMNTSGLLQSTLQETRSIHDSMNIPKIEFIAYIYILL